MDVFPSDMSCMSVGFVLKSWDGRLDEAGWDILGDGYDVRIWGVVSFPAMIVKAFELDASLWLVWKGGVLVGVVGLIPFPEVGVGDWESFIYLLPEFRGQGVARVVLNSMGVAGRSVGVKVWSDVRTSNEGSIAAHERLFPGLGSVEVFPSSSGYVTRRWLLTCVDEDEAASLAVPVFVAQFSEVLR